MDVACVIGAATKPGRLAQAVEHLAGSIRAAHADLDVQVMDLGEVRPALCDGRLDDEYDERTRAAVGAIGTAKAVVFASPVYRASLTGVLKNFLDLLPLQALARKPVGIVAMGASPHHYLAVDSHLRPVLAWFGAFTLPNSVYLTNKDFVEGRLDAASATTALEQLGRTLTDLVRAADGLELGPPPLAAAFT